MCCESAYACMCLFQCVRACVGMNVPALEVGGTESRSILSGFPLSLRLPVLVLPFGYWQHEKNHLRHTIALLVVGDSSRASYWVVYTYDDVMKTFCSEKTHNGWCDNTATLLLLTRRGNYISTTGLQSPGSSTSPHPFFPPHFSRWSVGWATLFLTMMSMPVVCTIDGCRNPCMFDSLANVVIEHCRTHYEDIKYKQALERTVKENPVMSLAQRKKELQNYNAV